MPKRLKAPSDVETDCLIQDTLQVKGGCTKSWNSVVVKSVGPAEGRREFVRVSTNEKWLMVPATGSKNPSKAIKESLTLFTLFKQILQSAEEPTVETPAVTDNQQRNTKSGKWSRHRAQGCIVQVSVPTRCKAVCPSSDESRLISLYVVDRRQVWLAREDMLWALHFLAGEVRHLGVQVVAEEHAGDGHGDGADEDDGDGHGDGAGGPGEDDAGDNHGDGDALGDNTFHIKTAPTITCGLLKFPEPCTVRQVGTGSSSIRFVLLGGRRSGSWLSKAVTGIATNYTALAKVTTLFGKLHDVATNASSAGPEAKEVSDEIDPMDDMELEACHPGPQTLPNRRQHRQHQNKNQLVRARIRDSDGEGSREIMTYGANGKTIWLAQQDVGWAVAYLREEWERLGVPTVEGEPRRRAPAMVMARAQGEISATPAQKRKRGSHGHGMLLTPAMDQGVAQDMETPEKVSISWSFQRNAVVAQCGEAVLIAKDPDSLTEDEVSEQLPGLGVDSLAAADYATRRTLAWQYVTRWAEEHT